MFIQAEYIYTYITCHFPGRKFNQVYYQNELHVIIYSPFQLFESLHGPVHHDFSFIAIFNDELECNLALTHIVPIYTIKLNMANKYKI